MSMEFKKFNNKILGHMKTFVLQQTTFWLILQVVNQSCTFRFEYLFTTLHLFVFALTGSQLPELQGMWGTIFAVASRVCAAGAYYACLQFASELFPTEIRGKGSSAFEISGGLGLFIQPQINYLVRISHCAKVQKYNRAKQVSNLWICGANNVQLNIIEKELECFTGVV